MKLFSSSKITIQSIFLISIIHFSCSEGPVETLDLLEHIESFPGVQVVEMTPTNDFARQFEIYITQPVDHNNPNGTQFTQKLYLWHRDISAPMVLLPSGYTCEPPDYNNELTQAMNANQLRITHRFMMGAEPSPMDWQYLTEEQNANDVHHVVELFKEIYTGKWISTGGSKNGMTALFHRRFFPEDADATVALYTPMPLGTADPRFDNFLEQVGTLEQRDRLIDFQRMVLEMRGDIIPRIRNFMNNSEFHYSLNADIILELEVCEFPFGFWQNFTFDEIDLPQRGSTPEEVYNFMTDLWGWDYYSDEIIEFFYPIYYQAYAELGWYRLVNDNLTDLLIADSAPSYSNYFTPPATALNYNPSVMQSAINWLQTEGNNIIYIYGANDPWTAAAVELTGQTNALKILQPNANHRLRISDLDDPGQVYTTLENWLEIEIDWMSAAASYNHNYNNTRRY